MHKRILLGATALAALNVAVPASALNIVLNQVDNSFSTSPNGAQALADFKKAAAYWNTVLTNNVTINIDISFAALAPNIIGSTRSNATDVAARSVYGALAATKSGALDNIAVANLTPLSAAGGVAYRMPDSETGVAGTGQGLGLETKTRGSVYDNDDSYNNTTLYANTANLKALGISVANPGAADASIQFSSDFNFDFNPTDGIGVGDQDFIAVAVHEMGHALGFVSGADTYDYYAHPAGPGAEIGDLYDWDDQSVLSVLDLFRRSTNPAASGGFVDGKRVIQLDPNREAALSLDGTHFFNAGSNTNGGFAAFSTGTYNGDGHQASHWKETNGYFDENGCFETNTEIGIMDPTSGSCQLGIVTGNDLAAMDAIGYNLNFDLLKDPSYAFNTAQIYGLAAGSVPEPMTWGTMLLGFGLTGAVVRRRKTSVSFAL